MSIRAITWAMEQKTGSPTTKLVLMKLADNANDEGLCWPAQSTIARHCEIDRSTVNRHIKRLVELGLIEVEQRTQDGVKLPNVYHLKLKKGCDEMQGVGAEDHIGGGRTRSQVGAEDHRGGRTRSQGVGAEDHIEPSVRTVIEPLLPIEGDDPSRREKPSPRKTAIPDGFPNAAAISAATSKINSARVAVDARREAEKFRDHALAKGARYVDWPAAFRNWIGNAITYAERDGRKAAPASKLDLGWAM